MSKRMQDKVTIITGGASGIGEGMVRRFCNEGARVLLADVNDDGLLDVAVRVGFEDRILLGLGDGTFLRHGLRYDSRCVRAERRSFAVAVGADREHELLFFCHFGHPFII